MIRFDHITKQYGTGTKALDDLTVEISDGEFVYLIGPSGAGKTSMLRLLIRDITPTSGTLFIDGTDLSKLPSSRIYLLRRNIGTVFQDFKLLLDRTVYENVSLALEIRGVKEDQIRKDVQGVLSLVGLSEKTHMFPAQLSAGELQRTSIARAIVGGPKVLLADEPTGNLDPQTSWDILGIIEEINKMGTTIIMATHNATIVNDTKRRTIALDHGRLQSDDVKGKYHVTHPKHPKKHDTEEHTS